MNSYAIYEADEAYHIKAALVAIAAHFNDVVQAMHEIKPPGGQTVEEGVGYSTIVEREESHLRAIATNLKDVFTNIRDIKADNEQVIRAAIRRGTESRRAKSR